MTIAIAGPESRRIAAPESLFAFVRNEHDFPGKHVDEFVAFDVPVPLAGPSSGRQAQLIDPELRQVGGIAEPLAFPCAAGLIKWRRIRGPGVGRKGFSLDAFGHVGLQTDSFVPQTRLGWVSFPRSRFALARRG